MKILNVRIVTPQEALAEREVLSAGFPGESGRFTVKPGHQTMICSLAEGRTVLKTQGTEETWTTGKGVLKVDQNTVTVLVHHASMT